MFLAFLLFFYDTEDMIACFQVHSLVVPPKEDLVPWLKYASICRRKGRLPQSRRILEVLLETDLNAFIGDFTSILFSFFWFITGDTY